MSQAFAIFVIKEKVIKIFTDLVKIDTVSGEEGAIADYIIQFVKNLIPEATFDEDDAHQKIALEQKLPGNCGNIFIKIPGNGIDGPPIGFCAHTDRVEDGKGIIPIVTEDKITSSGDTILAADDCAGIAVILNMLDVLVKNELPHPPLQLIFVIREETKLLGSRYMDRKKIEAKHIFVFDGENPAEYYLGACSSEKLQITVHGLGAHAGVYPHHGLNASLIWSLAITHLLESGMLGWIPDSKGKHAASINFNVVSGSPTATNMVQDKVVGVGEIRAFDPELLHKIRGIVVDSFMKAWNKAIQLAIDSLMVDESLTIQDRQRISEKLKEVPLPDLLIDRAYDSFSLKDGNPIVETVKNVMNEVGLTPKPIPRIMGGFDACWLNLTAPAIPLGCGCHNEHKKDEYLSIPEFVQACGLAIALATQQV